jgi:hypothetical protein
MAVTLVILPTFSTFSIAPQPRTPDRERTVEEIVILPRVNLIGAGDGDFYNFMAAIPMTVFHHDNLVYQSPLLFYSEYGPSSYLLEDWRDCLGGGVEHVNFIGEFPEEDIDSTLGKLCADEYSILEGDPISMANEIALHDWKRSDVVVIAPYSEDLTEEIVESVSNGAVLASLYNAPLLFASASGIGKDTCEVVEKLGVRKAFLIDLNDSLPVEIQRLLASGGVDVKELTSEGDFIFLIRGGTIGLIKNSRQALPAALACARYGGFVLFLPDAVATYAIEGAKRIPEMPIEKLTGPRKALEEVNAFQCDVASAFYSWIESLGGDDPDGLETVMTFIDDDLLPTTFDRALVGDPSEPEERGAITGRFPGDWMENIVYANRGMLYRALIFANPRMNRVTMSMVAYECGSPGSFFGHFADNRGVEHIVNEIWGYQDPDGRDDPGVYNSLRDAGYDIGFHNGIDAGVGNDPINHEPLPGFVSDIKSGSALFYDSSHGGYDIFWPMDIDGGIEADAPLGSRYWPDDGDGRIDSRGSRGYTSSRFDEDFKNMRCIMLAFNACSLAEGDIHDVAMSHGASAVVSSYVAVSFSGSGWYWCRYINEIASGRSIGHTNAISLADTSYMFPQGEENGDDSLMYVLFGDPNMVLAQPDWKRMEPGPLKALYGGHEPDRSGN